MARLYLVRHGKAAAGWDADPDPGLDPLGRSQAEAMAERLGPLGPLPVVASPLRRTRETAAALERRWGASARLEPRIAEVPSPVDGLAARGRWLAAAMQGGWGALEPSVEDWRRHLLAALEEYLEDTVLVTHFIAINVAVGRAVGDDRVVSFRPEPCSCSVIEIRDGSLRLIERGSEGAGQVL
jgi:broad specificity phosphatase PhoE